jgi:hypothetical protein
MECISACSNALSSLDHPMVRSVRSFIIVHHRSSSFFIDHHRSTMNEVPPKYRRRRYSQWTPPSAAHHSKAVLPMDAAFGGAPFEGAGRSYPKVLCTRKGTAFGGAPSSGALAPSYLSGSYRLVPKVSIESEAIRACSDHRSSSFIVERRPWKVIPQGALHPEGHRLRRCTFQWTTSSELSQR